MEYIELFEKILGPGKRSGGRVVFQCWRCDKGKPSSSRHLYVNPHTGRYKCYKCCAYPDGYGTGTAKFFAHLMGYSGEMPDEAGISALKAPPTNFKQDVATRVYTHLINNLVLLPEHKDMITSERGIRHPEAFGVRSSNGAEAILRKRFSDDDLVASGLFFHYQGNLLAHKSIWDHRIVIPYMDAERRVDFIKSRRTRNDGTMKYAAPIDAEGSRRVWGFLIPGHDTLAVTEGEFKGMASVEAKVLTLALPGMSSGHQTLIEMIKGSDIKHVVICFDTQIKDMKDVNLVASALAMRLRNETGVDVMRAHLPLEPQIHNGEKTDIDKYLFYHTAREYHAILRESARLFV